MQKSYENDQVTGHFQSFFVFVFIFRAFFKKNRHNIQLNK